MKSPTTIKREFETAHPDARAVALATKDEGVTIFNDKLVKNGDMLFHESYDESELRETLTGLVESGELRETLLVQEQAAIYYVQRKRGPGRPKGIAEFDLRKPGGGRKPDSPAGRKVRISVFADPDVAAFIEGLAEISGKGATVSSIANAILREAKMRVENPL